MDCTEGLLAEVRRLLADPALGVQAADPLAAQTTQRALANLVQLAPLTEPLYAALIGEIRALAQAPGAETIAAKDLSVWQTPEFVVWRPQDDSGFDAEPSLASQKAKAREKERAKAKAESRAAQSDAQWAAQLQAELNKDKLARDAAAKAIAARSDALQQQAEVRARVEAVARGYREALLRLHCLVAGGRSALLPHLTEVCALAAGLLSNPLAARLAREWARGAALTRRVFLECTQCVADASLAAHLEHCLFTAFYLSICSHSRRFPR